MTEPTQGNGPSETPNPWRISIRRNITWLFGASLLVKPIWLFFMVVLCWGRFGDDGYGIFSAALWLGFMLASLTDLGLTGYTTREVARDVPSASAYFSNLLTFRLSIAPVAWVLAIAAAWILGYSEAEMTAVSWAAAYTVSLSLTGYVRSYFRAHENLKLEGISMVVEKVLVVSVGTLALYVNGTVEGTLMAMAIAMFATLGLNIAWITQKLAPFRPALITRRFLAKAVSASLPLGLYSLFIVIYLRSGGVLLEYWHGPKAAGEFAGPYRIVEALLLLPAVMVSALLPRLSNLFHHRAIDDFRSIFNRSALVAVGLALLCAIVLTVAGKEIILLINPNAGMGRSGDILEHLAWIFPLVTFQDLLMGALVASDQQRFLAVGLGCSLVASLALNYALTRPYSADGLVWVYVLTEIIIIVLCATKLRTTLRTVMPAA